MKTAEEIKLKKAYLEGFVEGRKTDTYSCLDAEAAKSQIKILKWVLEGTVKPVNIKREGK